jgi:Flp pilus assembly pilin Flp
MLTLTQGAVLRIVAFYRGEEGQTLVKHSLILGLIAVVALAVSILLGVAIAGQVGSMATGSNN